MADAPIGLTRSPFASRISTRALPARFVAAAVAGNSFQVEAVDGFAVGDRVIASSRTVNARSPT